MLTKTSDKGIRLLKCNYLYAGSTERHYYFANKRIKCVPNLPKRACKR